MQVTFNLEGEGLHRFAQATAVLGSQARARRAYQMAINQVGRKAQVATVRALAKQTGLLQKDVRRYGGLGTYKATGDDLTYTFTSKGKPLPLKLFKAKQRAFGVVASPWGKTQRFPGAFIFAGTYKSGQPVHEGHVLHRAGKKRRLVHKRGDAAWHGKAFQPWEIMYGPAIPVEMVKDASAAAWLKASGDLPAQVERIAGKIMDGTIKA